jgi:hypothetical protein
MTGATVTDGGIIFVSFDVDGTLIKSAGQRSNMLHKQAFSYGFKKVFDLDTHIDIIQHHGGTDPLIILKVLEIHGISKEEVGDAAIRDQQHRTSPSVTQNCRTSL